MSFETGLEKGSSKPARSTGQKFTLQKAIEMGEYHPEFLSTFPEWHTFPRHVQFQYIREALENRNRQLLTQWAEISNFLDFSKKPHLNEALASIEGQMKILKEDTEKLYLEYSK